jgi:hypothetical protein
MVIHKQERKERKKLAQPTRRGRPRVVVGLPSQAPDRALVAAGGPAAVDRVVPRTGYVGVV